MARSKWFFLILAIGLCLSACGESTPTSTPVISESTPTPGISTTTTNTVAAITTLALVQTQPVSTTVFATTASPTTPFTTQIHDTTVPPPSPVIGKVYLAETTDGGISWSALVTQTNPLKVDYSGFDQLQCITNKTCAHIRSIEGVDYPYFDLVKDGTKNWKPFFTLSSTDVTCLSPDACWRLIYDWQNEVSFTKDRGVTWTKLTRYDNLKVNDANKEIYLKARRGPEIEGEIAFLHTISCVSESKCLLIGGGGRSIRTLDGGKTWDWFFTNTAFYIDSVCPGESTCYALARDGVSITTNFGETWQKLKISLEDDISGAISCLSENDCVVLNGKNKIYTTNDKGATWTVNTIPTNSSLADLSCPGDKTCYALAYDKVLWETRDAGKNWTPRPINLNITLNYNGRISCPATNDCLITNRAF